MQTSIYIYISDIPDICLQLKFLLSKFNEKSTFLNKKSFYIINYNQMDDCIVIYFCHKGNNNNYCYYYQYKQLNTIGNDEFYKIALTIIE